MRRLVISGALIGIIAGAVLGLLAAWFIWPVSYVDADPADLRLNLKDDYLRMIAASYSIDGDLRHAWARVGQLALQDPYRAPDALARREAKALYQQALIHLALDIQAPAVALARPTYTPRPTRPQFDSVTRTPQVDRRNVTATPTWTPTPSPAAPPVTLEPTALPPTSVPNPDATPFSIRSRTPLSCSETGGQGVIRVQVTDMDGKPIPGIAVEVSWKNGDEIVYTGLKPERGLGYAGLLVGPGTYSVRLTENGTSPAVEPLAVQSELQPCPEDSLAVYGWRVEFQAEPK